MGILQEYDPPTTHDGSGPKQERDLELVDMTTTTTTTTSISPTASFHCINPSLSTNHQHHPEAGVLRDSNGRVCVQQVDGVWSDDLTNKTNREAYYTKGDWIRFGFLFVLMTTLMVTIVAMMVDRKNNNQSNHHPSSLPLLSPKEERAMAIASYINSITFTNRTLLYPPSENSTEEKALKWIIDDDPAQRQWPDDAISIRQRYALALFWFQSNETFTDNQYREYKRNYTYQESWLTDHYECEWTGIICVDVTDDEGYGTEFITDVLLPNSTIHGQLSVDIAVLRSLVRLVLHFNSIQSPVPWSLSTMPYLRNLDLGNNLFSEPVPALIGNVSSLLYLSLANNDFYGTIPSSYQQNLINLTDLLLYNNSRMDGPIPDFSRTAPNLTQLLLYNNSFTGSLPEGLFYMTNLNALDVSGNAGLQGTLNFDKKTNSSQSSFSPFSTLLALHGTGMTGSLDAICDRLNFNETGSVFSADCDEIDCDCCQFCCPSANNTEWIPKVQCD